MCLIRAYDETGNNRPLFRIAEGDVLEWKLEGYAGFQCGRVTNIDEDRRCPIRLQPLKRATREVIDGARPRWIGRNKIMRVYWRDGTTRKQARPEDQAG